MFSFLLVGNAKGISVPSTIQSTVQNIGKVTFKIIFWVFYIM